MFVLRRTCAEVSSGAVKEFCALRFLNSEAVSGSTLRRRPRLEPSGGLLGPAGSAWYACLPGV